jgi:hypothetical protein
MEFEHEITLVLKADGTVYAKHRCSTSVDPHGGGEETTQTVSATRAVPIGGKTMKDVKKLLEGVRTVNQEAMETVCRRDALQLAHVVAVRDRALAAAKSVITGIDLDHNPDEEEMTHAEPGTDRRGDDGDGGDAGGDGPPRPGPVGGHRRRGK